MSCAHGQRGESRCGEPSVEATAVVQRGMMDDAWTIHGGGAEVVEFWP